MAYICLVSENERDAQSIGKTKTETRRRTSAVLRIRPKKSICNGGSY